MFKFSLFAPPVFFCTFDKKVMTGKLNKFHFSSKWDKKSEANKQAKLIEKEYKKHNRLKVTIKIVKDETGFSVLVKFNKIKKDETATGRLF